MSVSHVESREDVYAAWTSTIPMSSTVIGGGGDSCPDRSLELVPPDQYEAR